eukprot:EC713748.1.p2 GENE.EC713748.1~~EC713748.1.p2  ORF type:complete len:79 (-),score=14.55 EC713748.1:269-505(-)
MGKVFVCGPAIEIRPDLLAQLNGLRHQRQIAQVIFLQRKRNIGRVRQHFHHSPDKGEQYAQGGFLQKLINGNPELLLA